MREERTILGRIEPLVRAIALVIWLFIGVTRFSGGLSVWLIPWALYGLGVSLGAARERFSKPLNIAVLLLQSASVMALPLTGLVGFEGMLLSFVVVQLPTVLSMRTSIVWAALHLPVLVPIVFRFNNATQLLEMSGAYAGFSTFALLVHWVRLREQRARLELARSNASLLATRALLVEGSRQAERLRISRELHDSLGHHLTALNLHLDLAQRQAAGSAAAETLARARTISKDSLAEVRKVVSEMQAEQGVELVPALKALASGVPSPHIDIKAPDALELGDGETSHALFRCVQEAITNSVKHAAAQNVWVEISRDGGVVRVVVRDDGTGVAQVTPGRGLSGMSARVAQLGGAASFESSSGRGFSVKLELPVPA